MMSLLKIMLCRLILCFSVNSVQAITVSETAPQVTDIIVGGTSTGAAGIAAVQGYINSAWILARNEYNTELQKYGEQSDLAKGFANANAYAAQAGTLQRYQGYDLFAITTSVMVGAQLPTSPL